MSSPYCLRLAIMPPPGWQGVQAAHGEGAAVGEPPEHAHALGAVLDRHPRQRPSALAGAEGDHLRLERPTGDRAVDVELVGRRRAPRQHREHPLEWSTR
jgi:hypothetical protein